MAAVTARGTGSLLDVPGSLIPTGSARRARTLLAAPWFVAVAAIVLAGFGAIIPGVFFAVAAIAFAVVSWRLGSPSRILSELSLRPADPVREARLLNVTEGLCRANGLSTPRVAVLEDDAANAIVLGSKEANATLICSAGLLGLLDRMELEAVIAHELAHIKRGEVALAATASRALWLLAVVSRSAATSSRRLCGPSREVGADLDGVRMTRYPPALHSALHKIAEVSSVPAGLSDVTRRLTTALWLVPLSEGEMPALVGELDVAARLSALAEL